MLEIVPPQAVLRGRNLAFLSAVEAVRVLSRTGGSAMSVDVGSKKFGVAISTAPWSKSYALPVIHGRKHALQQIPKIAESRGVRLLILGWPIELSGRVGHRCEQVLDFVSELSLPAPAILVDERLTTQAARQEINLGEPRRWRRVGGKYEDGISARIILDLFLTKHMRI